MPSNIRIVSDINECAYLWQKYYPVECLFDLWQVRETFAKIYSRENFFVVHETHGRVNGLLPLCRITETANITTGNINQVNYLSETVDKVEPQSEIVTYMFFPGEIWNNRTWMEQNKIVAENSDVMLKMLLAVQANSDSEYNKINADIRYLSIDYLKQFPYQFNNNFTSDETGYLFYPANYDYSYEKYLASFAGKSRKKILSEITALEQQGLSFRYDNLEDLDVMLQFNINNFGAYGYFNDSRFLTAFKILANFLHEQKMLRVVTVLINNEIAAVDMGAVWNNNCIMLAGGTNKNFLGVAKLINLHHIEWACSDRIDSIDFLCGDFGWKERFHLTPRPLYQIILNY
ncbi:MAG: GNAT family N-acetyltransferase [Desulfamplus sp.]|nr:GNAT family N-acetyltransferase [Desulfamplus sp.]